MEWLVPRGKFTTREKINAFPLMFCEVMALALALTSKRFKLSPSVVAIDSVIFPTNKPSTNTFWKNFRPYWITSSDVTVLKTATFSSKLCSFSCFINLERIEQYDLTLRTMFCMSCNAVSLTFWNRSSSRIKDWSADAALWKYASASSEIASDQPSNLNDTPVACAKTCTEHSFAATWAG